ncbi:hypothetical protein [Virgibacillus salinus]|nr:hypothetical protein [Virgibacillus salinus]
MIQVTTFVAVFPVVVGMLLRFPKFIIEVKEKKEWIFDWVKYAVIGLPTLYIVVMSILPYSPFAQGKVKIPEIIFIGGPTITTISGIILGYILLDGLKK